jgi:hypothetical protein
LAKTNVRDHNYGKGKTLSSVDQALLDELCSTIADIAVRLTKDKVRDNNCSDSTKQEASEK